MPSAPTPHVSLAEALDAFLADLDPYLLDRGRWLARSFRARLIGNELPGVSTTFYDAGSHHAGLAILGGRLEWKCSCARRNVGSTCNHLVALALWIRADCLSPRPSPAVIALRRALAPPTPEQLLADVDELVAPLRVPAATADRAVWQILPNGDAVGVGVLVRSPLKSGEFGRPRTVKGKPLVEILRISPIPQDRAFLDCFTRRNPYYSRDDGQLAEELRTRCARTVSAELLAALAGHPELLWAQTGERARIVAASPGLRVSEVDGEARLVAVAGGFELQRDGLFPDASGFIALDDPSRTAYACEQGRLDQTTFLRLAHAPVTVPAAFASALVDRLGPVAAEVPVELPPSLRGRELAPDCTPRLVLEPQPAAGVVASLRVRPLPGGQLYPPGEGPQRVSAHVAGERTSCVRDRDTETERSFNSIELLALPFEAPAFDVLLDEEQVLDLLERLEDPAFAHLPVEWPAGPAVRLVGGSLKSRRVDVRAQADWFGVEGSVQVDSDTLALAELFAAHRAGRRYVALGPGRFAKVARIMDDRLERLAELTHDSRGHLVLSRGAVAQADTIFDELEVQAPISWRALADRARAAKTLDVTPPALLKAELREYQREGYAWMKRLAELGCGGVLADDMGLGKTVQAIAVLSDRSVIGPQLVLAPTSVSFNWARELARFAPHLRVHSLREADRASLLAAIGPGDVVLASYGLLRHEHEQLSTVEWASLVLDEAQAIKNWDTAGARAVRGLRAQWRIALTGTPVENHLGELYSLLETVIPGLFASWEQFARSFAVPIEKFRDKDRARALSRLVRPFILRRTKREVLTELPPRSEVRLDVVLPKAERRLYEAARLDALRRLEEGDGDSRFVALAALTRLRQIASCAHLVVPESPPISEKLRVLFDQLDEVLEEGRSALVFSQFVRQLDVIGAELTHRGVPHLVLTGETAAKDREARVNAFQRGDARVFLVSLKAGGTGLNLTAADTVFLLDPWWNPAVEDQAADRAHRIGQTRAVTIVRLVAKDTVEEKVMALHTKKRALVADLLSESDTAGRLSADDLVDLLRDGQVGLVSDDEPEPPPAPAIIEAPRDGLELERFYRARVASRISPQYVSNGVAGVRLLVRHLPPSGTLADRLAAALGALPVDRKRWPAGTRRLYAGVYETLFDELQLDSHLDADERARLRPLERHYRDA